MFADTSLADRIYQQNREFFSGLARAMPKSGLDVEPCLLDTGTTIAFFGGNGNPLTQANGRFTPDDIVAVTEFYRGRSQSWEALITPFADEVAVNRFFSMGAASAGWESVLVRDPSELLPPWECPQEISIERVQPDQIDQWLDISWKSFFGGSITEPIEMMNRLLRHADNIDGYLIHWNGKVAATASLSRSRGSRVDFLGGMATLPEFRGRGLQTAAIRQRLPDLSSDVEIVTMGAKPGSSSHRNAERSGFRVAYSQISLSVPAA